MSLVTPPRQTLEMPTWLDMTKRVTLGLAIGILSSIALAQETPTASPSPTSGESPSAAISPEQSLPPSSTPEQTASTSPARSVRISFVPPPMDGTISLGIYDQTGKLVRVLRRNALLTDFAIGADALVTRWDGKDDTQHDLPSGRYRAHGYLVGPLKREDLGEAAPPATVTEANRVKVRLVQNPLREGKRPIVELGMGFDREETYLQTSDGLPLFKVSDMPNVSRAGIATRNSNSVDIWQDDTRSVHQFRVLNVDQMMAFDCGEFELN